MKKFVLHALYIVKILENKLLLLCFQTKLVCIFDYNDAEKKIYSVSVKGNASECDDF